jgi:hypothetical protein
MIHLRFTARLPRSAVRALAFAALALGHGHAEENIWPFAVHQTDERGKVVSSQYVGPLIFRKGAAGEASVEGFRPLFARWSDAANATREINVLYPIFTYRTDGETYRWSVFQLINRSGDTPARKAQRPAAMEYETFDVWPFWFSRNTGEAQSSYHALFPIGGTIKSRLGFDELSWVLFPLYVHSEKKESTTISTPWPFIKRTHGAEQGFAIWPLYGHLERTNRFDRQFFLWPLGWNNTIQPDAAAPAGTPPRREVGFLPFFSRETDAGFVNQAYLWPFFGYTDRTTTPRYHEVRYFWPFLVQGRGDAKTVNRWGPFYTHSTNKGVDKTWIVWPLYREKKWADGDLAQTQRQLFYFLYRSTEQSSVSRPNAPHASKDHIWPLFSHWDNGAGREQFQFPSPLEVFFPDNERVRVSWSPLFSIYRFDQAAPNRVRHEWFWGLISWRRQPELREFHLGPLFSTKTVADRKRIAIGNGLLGFTRSTPESRWRFFWFDFEAKTNTLRATAR